jgi:hypothetical protein
MFLDFLSREPLGILSYNEESAVFSGGLRPNPRGSGRPEFSEVSLKNSLTKHQWGIILYYLGIIN